MARYQQTKSEVRQHLAEQVDFIKASAARYDAGYHSEAKRMAAHLRTLLYDGPPKSRSRALLTQLGSTFSWKFVDSVLVPYSSENLAVYHGLAAIRLQSGEAASAAFVPLLASGLGEGHPQHRKRFLAWWTDPVVKDDEGTMFGRKQLILAVANQDGGAHVDEGLDEAYAKLSRQNSIGLVFSVGDEPREWAHNPVPPSIRQVSQEVLWTLEDQGLIGGTDTGEARRDV